MPRHNLLRAMALAFLLGCLLLVLVTATVASVAVLAYFHVLSPTVAGVLNGVQVVLFQRVLSTAAIVLTEHENHRSHRSHHSAMVNKLFTFQVTQPSGPLD